MGSSRAGLAKKLWRLALVVSLVAVGCGREDQTAATSTTTAAVSATVAVAVAPKQFLREAGELIRANALHADRVDWERWSTQIDGVSSTAETTADTYPLVRALLADLEDNHSSLFTPDQLAAVTGSSETLDGGLPSGDTTSGIGHLRLPDVAAPADSDAAASYITTAREVLSAESCGWILDLRRNGGGNVFVMLSAAAPLLGAGPAVGYRSREGVTVTYEIGEDGGVVTSDGVVLVEPHWPLDPHPAMGPVAVLQDRETASSAEGIVMALRGRPMTRSFGAPTRGVPTGNQLFALSDGSALNLTTTKGVDHLGQTHDAPIDPDEAVAPRATGTDATLDAARQWLARDPACHGG